jgi:hypothetical protein
MAATLISTEETLCEGMASDRIWESDVERKRHELSYKYCISNYYAFFDIKAM